MRRDAVGAPAEAGGRVRLRVEVDEQAALAGLREAGGEVDGGRRLADAALLVRDCVDAGGHEPRLAGAADAASAARPAQASGRFFATPARRGKPGGVGPVLRIDEQARRARARARRRARSRHGRHARRARRTRPTQSTTAPPSRTSGRHHSAAVGGCASAFATATPKRLGRLLLGPAPHDGEVRDLRPPSVSRKAHLRRSASSSVTGAVGERGGQRDPGRAPTRADVDDRRRPSAATSSDCPQRVVEQHAARGGGIAERGQARRRDDRREPAVERPGAARRLSPRIGAGGRRRTGSARCPRSTSRPRDRP